MARTGISGLSTAFFGAWAFFGLGANVSLAGAGCPSEWLPGRGYPGVWGTPFAILVREKAAGSVAYLCGAFDRAGDLFSNGIVGWNGVSWIGLDGGFTKDGNPGIANCITEWGGDLVVGGDFNAAGNTSTLNIARWDGSTWQPLGGGLPGEVTAVTIYDGEVVAAAWFELGENWYATRVMRFDGSHWQPVGDDTFGEIKSLVVHRGELLAGGMFFTAGGAPADYLARWDGASWTSVTGSPNGSVNAMAVVGTDLVVGGYFWSAGGKPVKNLARWDGQQWFDIGGGVDGGDHFVTSLLEQNGSLIVGGQFATAGTIAAQGVARWDGNEWYAFGAGLARPGDDDYFATCLETWAGKVIVGGNFPQGDWGPADRLAIWNGTEWERFCCGLDGDISSLAKFGNQVVAGGSFRSADGRVVNRIAWWDGAGWNALGAGADGSVHSLTTYGDELVAGGNFTSMDGLETRYIARFDGTKWSPLGPGLAEFPSYYTAVYGLASYRGELVATGRFYVSEGSAAKNIATWNGNAWQPLGLGLSNPNYAYGNALTVYRDELIVGGLFQSADGVGAGNIARWNGTAWARLGTGLYNGNQTEVSALLVFGDELIAGGKFIFSGAPTLRNIARWNGSAWTAMGQGFNNPVESLVVFEGELYAGGGFTSSATPVGHIARWSGTTWVAVDVGIDPASSAGVSAMLGTDGLLSVGGSFWTAGGAVSHSFAQWRPSVEQPTIIQQPRSQAVHLAQMAQFSVGASGSGFESFQWRLGGEPIASNAHFAGTTTPNLTINGVERSDAGVYDCVIANSCGSAVCDGARLTVIQVIAGPLGDAVSGTPSND